MVVATMVAPVQDQPAVVPEIDLQAVDAPVPAEKTASQQVREWTRQKISGEERVKAPALAAAGLKDIGNDTLLIELGRVQFYRIVLETIGDTRGMAGDRGGVTTEKLSPDELKARWNTYLEHAGQQHIAVTSLTYQDLLLAVAERRKQVAPILAEIEFLVNLGNEVKDTNLTVGQKLTPEQIEAIRQAANAKYKVVS